MGRPRPFLTGGAPNPPPEPDEVWPSADTETGLWTPTPLWTALADPAETTLITSTDNAHDSATVDYGPTPNGTLQIRLRKNQAGGHNIDATITVRDAGIQIDQWTVPVDGWQTVDRQVPACTDLQVTVTRAGQTGGSPAGRRSLQVAWAGLFRTP